MYKRVTCSNFFYNFKFTLEIRLNMSFIDTDRFELSFTASPADPTDVTDLVVW